MHGLEGPLVVDSKIDSPLDQLERRELRVLIHEAVVQLPESLSLREAVMLFYFEGFNVAEMATFLDVPVGTVKRRLHDGRDRLRSMATNILKGTKPMNTSRDRVLKQLRDLIDHQVDGEELHDVMKQALTERPIPFDLMKEVVDRPGGLKARFATTESRAEMEQRSRNITQWLSQPSEPASDPNHSVGKVSLAIQAALPQFQLRSVDPSRSAQSLVRLFTGERSFADSPQDTAEGTSLSYLYATMAALFRRDDDSFCTPYELMMESDSVRSSDQAFQQRGHISDVLTLVWMRPEPIELRDVEEQLRQLQLETVPHASARFVSYSEPRYRSGLRMELEPDAVPAAIGGILTPWPGMPEAMNAAQVQIYLEAWAAALSGDKIALVKLAPLLELLTNEKHRYG